MKKDREKKIYDMVLRHYEADKKYRDDRGLVEMFTKYERYYRNEYWVGSGRPSHLSRLTSNLLYEGIEAMLPVVTSRSPKPEITPRPSEYTVNKPEEATDYAKKIQRECIKIWRETDMQQKIQSGFREHSVKGKWVLKSVWDGKEIVNETCNILTVFPDRFADSLKSCEKTHFIHAVYKSVMEIKEIYDIDVEAEGVLSSDGEFVYSNEGAISGAVEKAKGMVGMTTHKSEGHALVLEYYTPDDTEEEYDDYEYDSTGKRLKDETGNLITKILKREMYPNGKIITIVRSHKNKIVSEVQNPYKRLPFFDTTNNPRAGDFWGTSEGQNIENQMLALNQVLSNRNDNIRFLGNPETVVDEKSGIDEVTNEPGHVYYSNVPNPIVKIAPPPMGTDAERFAMYLREDADRTRGIADVFRGLSQSGDSGTKVQSLISQATGRLQPKTLAFVEFSRQIYEHWANIIQTFYDAPIYQKADDEEGQAVYDVFHPQDGADIDLLVDVSTMSMLPFDKYAEWDEAMKLVELGFMSPEQFIDLAPSLRDKQRAKDFLAQQQEQQQAMEAQPQGTPLTPEEEDILQSTDKEAIAQVLQAHPELAEMQ